MFPYNEATYYPRKENAISLTCININMKLNFSAVFVGSEREITQ